MILIRHKIMLSSAKNFFHFLEIFSVNFWIYWVKIRKLPKSWIPRIVCRGKSFLPNGSPLGTTSLPEPWKSTNKPCRIFCRHPPSLITCSTCETSQGHYFSSYWLISPGTNFVCLQSYQRGVYHKESQCRGQQEAVHPAVGARSVPSVLRQINRRFRHWVALWVGANFAKFRF